MEIDVVAPLDLSAEDTGAWSRLQAETPEFASPFLSPYWAQALARVAGPDRTEGRVAVLRDAGEAVGFLPARVSRSTALPLGAPLCDYQAAVTRPGLAFEPCQLVRALGVSRLDFTHLIPDQRFSRCMRGQSESQVVDVSAGFDAYAAERRAAGTSILQDSAKKRRKLEREHGPALFTANSVSDEDFAQLIAWKRAQYRATGQTDIFNAEWPLDLLHQLFETRGEDFGGTLFTLHVEGKLAAAHFTLRGRDVLHGWFIAHDDEGFGRYSPGVLLIVEMLRWAAENGYRELDLGPGDYRFKLSLANVKRPVAHGFVGLPSAAALVREAAYGLRGAAEQLPLGRVSALPGKAMRRLDLWRALG